MHLKISSAKWRPFCRRRNMLTHVMSIWDTMGSRTLSSLCLQISQHLTYLHEDVINWKHFPCYWPFMRGIHWSPVNSPHKGQWRGALMFSLICALNKRLSKQSWSWWFETLSHSLWRLCNGTLYLWIDMRMSKYRLQMMRNKYDFILSQRMNCTYVVLSTLDFRVGIALITHFKDVPTKVDDKIVCRGLIYETLDLVVWNSYPTFFHARSNLYG